MKKTKLNEIKDYDNVDTSVMIDKKHPKRLSDLSIELPDEPPTKVISLRLPSSLLNKIQAYASQKDISYSALIKIILSEEMDKRMLAG